MTAPARNDESIPPVVCTLTPRKLVEQALEWSDLSALALSRETLADGAASTYPLDMADKIEDLAARELSCCGTWLRIEHVRNVDHLRLELTTTNPEGLEIIRRLSR